MRRRVRERYLSLDEEPTPYYPKKQRRRWCRGRVGVEHDPAWEMHKFWATLPPDRPNPYRWEVYVCRTCGRILKYRRSDRS